MPTTEHNVRRRLAISASSQARQRKLYWLTLALIVLLVFDLWVLWPFFTIEMRRLEPWKVVLIWIGDATALLWGSWFIARYLILGKPLEDRPLHGRRFSRSAWRFILTLALAVAVDLIVTLYLHRADKLEYETATPVIAKVTGMHANNGSEGWNFDLHCEHVPQDQSDPVETLVRVHVEVKRGEPKKWPSTLTRAHILAMKADKPLAEVPIRYHPQWPSRVWLEGVPVDENGMTLFSLVVLFFQAMVLFLVAILVYTHAEYVAARGKLPWWMEFREVVPFCVQVAVMAYWATLVLAFG